jgi:hypothetical protein
MSEMKKKPIVSQTTSPSVSPTKKPVQISINTKTLSPSEVQESMVSP